MPETGQEREPMNQTINTVQTIANLTIDRTNRTVKVNETKVPTLLREYLLLDRLAQCQGPVTLTRLGRKAFASSELRTEKAVLAIASNLRRKLTSYGARRGLLRIQNEKISMFISPETVTVEVFHVPSARFTAGPADGSITPDASLCELTWAGTLPESDDNTVLDQTFHLLNIDDRPNRLFAPSLSVGDIVTLQPGTPEAASYQADRSGWIRLGGTIEADSTDRDLVSNQLAAGTTR